MYRSEPVYHSLKPKLGESPKTKAGNYIPWQMKVRNRSSKPSRNRSRMAKWWVHSAITSRRAWIMVVDIQTLMSS